MRSLGIFSLVFSFHLISNSVAQKTTGRFIQPAQFGTESNDPKNFKVYKVGEILDVSWTTNASEGAVFDLVIGQVGTPLTQIDRTPNSDSLTKTSYSWKITTDGSDGGSKFDLLLSNQFNFVLFRRDETASIADSVFFNISNSTVNARGEVIRSLSSSSTSTLLPTTSSRIVSSSSSSITSSSSSSFSLTRRSGTSSATPSASSAGIPQTTATPPPSTGLSSQATIFIGVGIGLLVAALIAALAVWFLYFRRKRRNKQDPMMEQVEPTDANHNWSPPVELQGAAKEWENGCWTELSEDASKGFRKSRSELPG